MLRFYAYFQESVLFSPEEDYRVRPVVVYYYLEDDTMSIIEPRVQNSGLSQGTRIKRQRLPKAGGGLFYMWKDLNIAMDLEVYGVKYRIVQCDTFTQVRQQTALKGRTKCLRALFQLFHLFDSGIPGERGNRSERP